MAESMCWSGVTERNQLRPPTISLGFSPSITLCLSGTMCQPCGTVTNMCTSQAGWRGLSGRKSTLNSVMELCKLIFLLSYDHVTHINENIPLQHNYMYNVFFLIFICVNLVLIVYNNKIICNKVLIYCIFQTRCGGHFAVLLVKQ